MKADSFAVVPARDGIEWLLVSVRMFRVHALRYTSLAALFLLIMQLASVISGGLLFVFLKPVLSVGFLAAAWHHERGEVPETRHLFAGFKSNLKALLPLGGVYLLGILFAASVALAVSGLSIEQLVPQNGQAKLDEQEQMKFMLMTVALTLPVTAALWFAPALIVFSDATFVQALLMSCRACLRNWLAMSAYGIAIFLLLLLVLAMAAPFLFFMRSAAIAVVLLFAVPLTAILMISDYVSYRRIFHRNEQIGRVI